MDRYRELQKTSLITIAANVILAASKLVIGLFSRSTAVVSDAVHTLSDVFTTILVMAGLKFSNEKADDGHPYGHQRIESVISLFLAFALAATALFLGYEGIKKIQSGEGASPSWLALGVTVLSVAVKEWMFQYTRAKAKRLGSTSLMSDAWHHRTDALSSIAVLVGVVGSFFGIRFLDPAAAIAVCVIILKAVYSIGREAINQLIDCAAAPEVLVQIEALALGVEGVKSIDLLRTRISNNVIFADLEIEVDSSITVQDGHKIAEEVHDLLESSGLAIEHCMVHVNPCVSQ